MTVKVTARFQDVCEHGNLTEIEPNVHEHTSMHEALACAIRQLQDMIADENKDALFFKKTRVFTMEFEDDSKELKPAEEAKAELLN